MKAIRKILTIFLALSTLFFIIRLAPGDPIERILGPKATQEEILAYQNQLGLDLPLVRQYWNYFSGMLRGEMGLSLYSKDSVSSLLVKRMPPTMTLAFLTIFLSTPLGIILGLMSALNVGSWKDYLFKLSALILLSVPIFSLGPLLVLIFAIHWELFPVSEWGEVKHVFLPVITLVLPLSAIVSRVMRNKYLEESKELWATVLMAKGLFPMAIVIRQIKVTLPTILNIVAIQLSIVLAGTMITETIFDIPGMGTLLFESIQNRDYPVVQGIMIYSSLIYMVVFSVIDRLNNLIDPRIAS